MEFGTACTDLGYFQGVNFSDLLCVRTSVLVALRRDQLRLLDEVMPARFSSTGRGKDLPLALLTRRGNPARFLARIGVGELHQLCLLEEGSRSVLFLPCIIRAKKATVPF